MIRLAHPEIGDEEVAAVTEVLRSGQLVQGKRVAGFEAQLAEMMGIEHVVAVTNGTAALHLALLALGIGRGDKVAVPTFSWPATANAVEVTGARPVFVDIEDATFGMDPERLEDTLVGEHGIKAVLPVHAFGYMAQVDRVSAIARRHGIPVIEDAACALGAVLDGVPAGRWGAMGCFSFHPRKAVTTGEGGAIVTPSAEHARTLRALRNHGLDPAAAAADFILPGFNCRMTEMQAAVGSVQLTRLDSLIASRRAVAMEYDRRLAFLPVVTPQGRTPGAHVYQSYVVLLPADVAPHRAQVIAGLRDAGVEATVGTYHMPLITYYRTRYGFCEEDFPVGASVAGRALALPLHARLTGEDLDVVVGALRGLLQA